MFESLSATFYVKLLIFLPVLLIVNWIFKSSLKREKFLKVAFNAIWLLFFIGLIFITFKYS